MDIVCRSEEAGLLISPSCFCLLGNNHSLPYCQLGRHRSSPYTVADGSHCREPWSVNTISFQHLPIPSFPQFNHMYSWRQTACSSTCCPRYGTSKGVEKILIFNRHIRFTRSNCEKIIHIVLKCVSL